MIESQPVRILLVEDDEVDRMAVQRLFAKESLPYDLVVAKTVAEATCRLREGGIGLVLIDHRLPDGTGLDVQKEAAETPNIFITGADDLSIAVEAMKAGAADFLVKDAARHYLQLLPLTIESTLKQQEHVKARYRAEEALQRAHDELEVQVRERTVQLVSTVARLVTEVEERRRVEEDLQESEQRYRSLIDDVLDTSATGIFILDSEFKIVWISQAIEPYFGLRREEVIGKDKRQVIRERIKDIFEDPEAFADKVLATYENNTYVERFECHVLPDGQREERWLEHRSLPIRLGLYAGGRIETYYDITSRVAAERALETHARQQEVVVELGRYALKGDDLADVMKGVVGRVAETLGVEYCNVLELLPDGQALLLLAGVGWKEGCVGRATVPSGQGSQAGYTLLTEGPNIVEDLQTETRFSGQPLLYDHGVVSGMCVMVQGPAHPWGVLGAHSTQRKIFSKDDVNFLQAVSNLLADAIARKRVEEELAASETNYHEVFNAVNDVVFIHDKETGAVLDVNATWCQVFGYTCEEVRQLVVGDFSLGKPPYTQEDAVRWVRKAAEEGPQLFEWLCKKKSGELFWVEVSLKLAVIGGEERVLAVVRDISERKLAGEALRRSERKYRVLFEESADATLIIDQNRFVDCNDAVAKMLRYSNKADLLRTHPSELSPETQPDGRSSYEKADEMMAIAFEKGSHRFEWDHKRADGEVFPVEVLLTAVPAGDKSILHVVWRDITERKRVEKAIQESEQRFRTLVEQAPDGILLFDLALGRFIEANPSVQDLLGYTRDELLQKHWVDISAPIQPGGLRAETYGMELVQEALAGSGTVNEWLFLTNDGKELLTELRLTTLIAGDRELLRASLTDITERKRAEEALRESEQRFRAIFEKAPLGVAMIHSHTGRFIRINPKYCDIVGYTKEEMLNLDFQTITHPDDLQEDLDNMAKLIQGQIPLFQMEKRYFRKDRSIVWVSLTVVPMWSEREQPEFHLVMVEDITQRKRAEEERENLIAKLETQNAELERFTYTVSHDLKSPLITLKGFMGVLKEDLADGDGEAIEDDLTRMASAADKMARLLDELLELSRIGRVVNPPEDVALGEIAREAMELVGGKITHGGVQVEIAADMPIIFGDGPRLVEVLQNLIENAVKWTADLPDPRIIIGARQDNRETVCYVRDNGTGIDPRHHEKIFGLFEKLDPRSEGSGVGLALVKRIIEVHGGRIWIESEGVGRGSTFCFTLPQRTDSRKLEEVAR